MNDRVELTNIIVRSWNTFVDGKVVADPTYFCEQFAKAVLESGWLKEQLAETWNDGFMDCVDWWEIHHAQTVPEARNPYRKAD